METSTVMVNGQGDGCAQVVSVNSEEEVASILENISKIVDDASDLKITHSLCKAGQNKQLSSLLPLKSVLSDDTDPHSKDEHSHKGDRSVDIEIAESSCELSPNSLPSQHGVSAQNKSYNHSQDLSPESAKTLCDDSIIMTTSVANKPSSLHSSKSLFANVTHKNGSIGDNAVDIEGSEISSKSSQKPLPSLPESSASKTSPNHSEVLSHELITTLCEDSLKVTVCVARETKLVLPVSPLSPKLDTSLLTEHAEESLCSKGEKNGLKTSATPSTIGDDPHCDCKEQTIHSIETSHPVSQIDHGTVQNNFNSDDFLSNTFSSTSALDKTQGTIVSLSEENKDQHVLTTKSTCNPSNEGTPSELDDSGLKSCTGNLSDSKLECSNNLGSNNSTNTFSTVECIPPKQSSSFTLPLTMAPDIQDDPLGGSPNSVSHMPPQKTQTNGNALNNQQPQVISQDKETNEIEKNYPQSSKPSVSEYDGQARSLSHNSPSERPNCDAEKCKNESGSLLDVACVASSSKDIVVLRNSCKSMEDEELDKNEDMVLAGDANDLCDIKVLESSSIIKANGFVKEHKVIDETQQLGEENNPRPNTKIENNENSIDTEKNSIQLSEKVIEGCAENSASSMSNKIKIVDTKQEKESVEYINDKVALKEHEKMGSKTALEALESSVISLGGKGHGDADQGESDAVIVIGEESESKSTVNVVKNVSFKDTPIKMEAGRKEAKLQDEETKVNNHATVSRKSNLDEFVTQKSPDEEKNELQTDLNEVSIKNMKKRSYSMEETEEPKRQKMDEAVKDVSEMVQSDPMEVIDSDDDVILAEDPSIENKISNSSKLEILKEGKGGDNKDNKIIDTKDASDIKDQNFSPINLSNQVLHAFITARIKAFIKKQKQQQIDKLNQRISMMQSSTSLWKETARHLERSVKEVTVLNQGVEKRRAHVNACKKLSSRTVGTQVNDDKVKSALNSVQHAIPPTWRSQITPPRPSVSVGSTRFTRPSAPSTVRPPPPASDVVNLIDLTDDDEVSKKSSQSHLPAANPSHHPASISNRTNVSSSAGTAKAANTSSNGFIPLTQSRTLMNSSVQHHPSLAGPQAQTIASTATLGHTQMRSNARLIQLPNHPLASGTSLGHPSNTGSNTQSASVTGKQAQEASSTALSTTKSNWITKHTLPPSLFIQQQRHPAPLPQTMDTVLLDVRALKLPPKPTLKISRVSQGIVLSWNMPSLVGVEVITSYQLFAYQETDSAPKTSLWKKVGDVRALPLPMACTLTQFLEGNKYHFAVRAIDKFNRSGAFSDPSSIFLGIGSTNTKIASRG